VNGYLLDTNIALKALTDPDELPSKIRKAISTGPNVLSVICYWEVVLKSMKGNLDVGNARSWWLDALDQLAATPLPLRPEHITGVLALPSLPQDPFDRILIAQAIAEDLTLVTTDRHIPRYASTHRRVLS
jgi:PIN domain nuclease of toxin-antitoxin system